MGMLGRQQLRDIRFEPHMRPRAAGGLLRAFLFAQYRRSSNANFISLYSIEPTSPSQVNTVTRSVID